MKERTTGRGRRRALGFGLLPILVACVTSGAVPRTASEAEDPNKPSLVVVLVVDQLRGDLLDRYSDLFTGGFKRLLDRGLNFTNALHQHAQTETSPGHAAISTGVVPSRAGIPSNTWHEGEDEDLRAVYNVVDPSRALVGITGLPGASPEVLRRPGMADWFLEADPESKIVSVSGKDRAAVLMAGKSKGDVYWFESAAGRFVTSTYYKEENPLWLDGYNQEGLTKYLADSVWVSTVPPEHAHLSAPDTAHFEGDGIHTFFPHAFTDVIPEPVEGDFYFWFETTPMLDEATLEVALLAMEEEGLGVEEDRTDYLSISFSQTDRVGHSFGPLSREQMDNLLRLDRVLDRLFLALDSLVGPQGYVVGFTGDHGVMNNPERIDEGGLRLTDQHRFSLEQALSGAARQSNQRPDLSTADALVAAMADLPFVGPTYTHPMLENPIPGDSIAQLFRHSYTPDRPGGLLSRYGVEMWWAENTLAWGMPMGTTHGSPFRYDRWVPLILLGPGIEPGAVDTPVTPMDLAPTLAGMAGVPFPDDLDGKPLSGLGSGHEAGGGLPPIR